MNHDTDRTKFDDRDYSVVCFQCGETFEATRSDASFCSAKCRVAYGREPQKLQNAIDDLEAVELRIAYLTEKYKHNTKMFEAVKSLAVTVNAAVRSFERGQEK